MGSGRWDSGDWASYASTTSSKATSAIYTARRMDPELDPKNFKVRESCDSPANPNSTPIILASDVTGSMGELAGIIARKGLGLIMGEIYDKKPITDPHILCAAIGDVTCDSAPLQATQFEAEVDPLTKQLEKIYVEGGGGGNRGESYNAAWYLAAYRTKCDAILKGRRKGYIFTIGDEPPLLTLSRADVKLHFGDDLQEDLTSRGLLDVLEPNWEVFHLRVKDYPSAHEEWIKLLGQRVIPVSNWEMLAEVVVSTIRVCEGEAVNDVVDSWSGDTSVVVADSLRGRSISKTPSTSSVGVVTL